MEAKVQDNPDRSRFEVIVDGEVGGFANYRVRASAVSSPGRPSTYCASAAPGWCRRARSSPSTC
jgi:hypothetical protein